MLCWTAGDGSAYPGLLALDKIPPCAYPALASVLPLVVMLPHCLQLDLLLSLVLFTPCSVIFQLQHVLKHQQQIKHFIRTRNLCNQKVHHTEKYGHARLLLLMQTKSLMQMLHPTCTL